MRRIFFTFLILTGFFTSVFAQPDNFLLPEDFFPHKSETLNLHLLSGSTFSRAREVKYDAKNGIKFFAFEGSKGVDITSNAKANSSPVLSYKLDNSGMLMFQSIQNTSDELLHREYVRYLTDNGLDKIAVDLKQFQQSFKQKKVTCTKTLIAVDKNGGSVYEKPVKADYEIILSQNPYKQNYGDDVTAVVLFKGKPLKDARVDLVIRSAMGTEYPQMLMSNESGEVYFKLSREGTYLLHSIHIEPSKDPNLDFENWQAAFTFAFSSSNTMPNSYKEFGLGNMH